MDETDAAETLAALGNVKRLEVFRLLVRAGHDGLTVGEIQVRMGVPPSTLAHHIAHLVKAGLVTQDRRGREVRCIADYGTMQTVFAFMTDQCCAGVGKLAEAG